MLEHAEDNQAGLTQSPDPVNLRGAGVRILLQATPAILVCMAEWIKRLLYTLALSDWPLCRRKPHPEYFLMVFQLTHLEMALDFAVDEGRCSGPVKSMQVGIDPESKSSSHSSSCLSSAEPVSRTRRDVVCKAGVQDLGTEQALLLQMLAEGAEFVCLQETPATPADQPNLLLRNALDPELRVLVCKIAQMPF